MILEPWMKSFRPEEPFDDQGRLIPELAERAPKGEWRRGANPNANGGMLPRDLEMQDFRGYAVKVPNRGEVVAGETPAQGEFMRNVMKLNAEARDFRIFSPDETASNRWGALFEATNRCSTDDILPGDEHVVPDGRVMEMVSEHQCQVWIEGWLSTGDVVFSHVTRPP